MASMGDLARWLDPVLFLGGKAADYAVEVMSNGGLGTRHRPTGRWVPHVIAKVAREQLRDRVGPLSGVRGLAALVQIGSTAFAGANLGVGLLNLGLSAWNAWTLHKLSGGLGEMHESARRTDARLQAMHSLVESSSANLSRLVQENAMMLDVIAERQGQLGTLLTELRRDLSHELHRIHATLVTAESQRESYELASMLRALLLHHEVARRAAQAGHRQPRMDLEQVVTIGTRIAAWVEVRSRELEVGAAQRLPLIIASAIALRLEIDARTQLDAAPDSRSDDLEKLKASIARELTAIVDRTPVWQLARGGSMLVEQYVYLHRSLQMSGTLVELPDGELMSLFPARVLEWNDGLERVRAMAPLHRGRSSLGELRLEALAEHSAWRSLSGHVPTTELHSVPRTELMDRLGLARDEALPDEELRELLRASATGVSQLRRSVDQELRG